MNSMHTSNEYFIVESTYNDIDSIKQHKVSRKRTISWMIVGILIMVCISVFAMTYCAIEASKETHIGRNEAISNKTVVSNSDFAHLISSRDDDIIFNNMKTITFDVIPNIVEVTIKVIGFARIFCHDCTVKSIVEVFTDQGIFTVGYDENYFISNEGSYIDMLEQTYNNETESSTGQNNLSSYQCRLCSSYRSISSKMICRKNYCNRDISQKTKISYKNCS